MDVRKYPFEQLRAQIGMVPQEAVLFSGTIRSNLLWGQEDATEEQLNRALRIAQAQLFVSQLPEAWIPQSIKEARIFLVVNDSV